MARTVLVTPAQRRAAEALVSWYEATKQPVAGAVRQIAAPEALLATAGPAHPASVDVDGTAVVDLLPHLPDAATARAVQAYNDAVRDLVAAYDVVMPNWSKSVAMAVLRLEMARIFRRSAGIRRRLRPPASDNPPPAEGPGADPPTET